MVASKLAARPRALLPLSVLGGPGPTIHPHGLGRHPGNAGSRPPARMLRRGSRPRTGGSSIGHSCKNARGQRSLPFHAGRSLWQLPGSMADFSNFGVGVDLSVPRCAASPSTSRGGYATLRATSMVRPTTCLGTAASCGAARLDSETCSTDAGNKGRHQAVLFAAGWSPDRLMLFPGSWSGPTTLAPCPPATWSPTSPWLLRGVSRRSWWRSGPAACLAAGGRALVGSVVSSTANLSATGSRSAG
jgi:hypothetical protein